MCIYIYIICIFFSGGQPGGWRQVRGVGDSGGGEEGGC